MTSNRRAGRAEIAAKFPALTARSLADTNEIASALAGEAYGGLVIILSGGLGAGKTALTRRVADALGARGVKSPTFAAEAIHRLPDRDFDLVHADLYRFDAAPPGSETDMQFQEYLAGPRRHLMIIEWGERWTPPSGDRWDINIAHDDGGDELRTLTLSAFGEDAIAHLSRAYESVLGSAPWLAGKTRC
jgi:tRNA threonylcarbamoyladenosine biosynthesis protein TsaE